MVNKRAASSHFSPGSNIFKGGKSPDVIEDAMIAANARVHGLCIAARNEWDFEDFRVEITNPFELGAGR